MRVAVFFAALSVVSGCASVPEIPYSRETEFKVGDDEEITEDRRVYLKEQLYAQRAIWASNKPDDYQYVLQQSCACWYGPAYGPNVVKIEEGLPKTVTYRGETRDGFKSGDALSGDSGFDDSVEDLFVKIEDILTEKRAKLPRFKGRKIVENFAVTYDTSFGFPTRISYDMRGVSDEEYVILLENFAPL